MDDVVWSISIEIGSPNLSPQHPIKAAGSGCGRLPHQDGLRMDMVMTPGNAVKAELRLMVVVPARGRAGHRRRAAISPPSHRRFGIILTKPLLAVKTRSRGGEGERATAYRKM